MATLARRTRRAFESKSTALIQTINSLDFNFSVAVAPVSRGVAAETMLLWDPLYI
jgi:hypothetical protein